MSAVVGTQSISVAVRSVAQSAWPAGTLAAMTRTRPERSTETLTIWSPLKPQPRHSESAGLGDAPDSPACTVPQPAMASSRMTAISIPLRGTVPMLELGQLLARRNRQRIYNV